MITNPLTNHHRVDEAVDGAVDEAVDEADEVEPSGEVSIAKIIYVELSTLC